MRGRWAVLVSAGLVAGLAVGAQGPAQAAAAPIAGFTPAHAAREAAAEAAYAKVPSSTVARSLDAYLARKTGLISTTGDRRRVDYVVAKLRSYGLRPQVRTYYPYISIPRHVSVSMVAPHRETLPNKEKCYSVETDCANVVVGYNALSPSGNVTAPVVYANYGTVQDYAVLAQHHVSVRGKIVLARYGGVFRGVKTNLAAEHGARAVIIYSDPADDGYRNGTVYPAGPWRNANGIQRGSVQQLWQYGGDPLTPGYAATRDAKRIDPRDANIAKIPTAPISYGAAKPLLQALAGPTVPKAFQGGLPFTYHFGPGPTQANVDLKIDYQVKPEWDVTATIPGRSQPDQTVYVGGHRDTWTYGSDDNLSGTEAVLQIGRGLGQLLRTGWRPERSITLAAWDGEEYGLFGSTEYAEDMGSRLRNAVAYINMDVAAGKDFNATAVPTFDQLVYDTSKQVRWPHTTGSIYDAWGGGKKPTVARLGSGSDYTAFLDHFGVPSVDIGASTNSGDYHCACDNFHTEDQFIDPGWKYHVAMAQEVGLVTMRLANADVLPLGYGRYAGEVAGYLADFAHQEQAQLGRVPVDVTRDVAAAHAWQRAATSLAATAGRLLRTHASPARYRAISRALSADERQLLTANGLPGRPWYEHQIYAPGVNSGYGTQLLPGLNDALFLRHDPTEARSYEARLHAALLRATAALRAAS